jgi:hypothetical protein
MHKHLWFSLIASLFVQCVIGQTDGSAARHEKAVEENLHYLAVIKGRPDPGMSLADVRFRQDHGTGRDPGSHGSFRHGSGSLERHRQYALENRCV